MTAACNDTNEQNVRYTAHRTQQHTYTVDIHAHIRTYVYSSAVIQLEFHSLTKSTPFVCKHCSCAIAPISESPVATKSWFFIRIQMAIGI